MEDVIKKFIINYNLVEHYFDSAKYKKFKENNPIYCYEPYEYESTDLFESISSYPYFHLELDVLDDIFYEFKVLYHYEINVLIENFTKCILLNKPYKVTLNDFINEIDKKITENKCYWNVYASK
jgi:hypothetical protein